MIANANTGAATLTTNGITKAITLAAGKPLTGYELYTDLIATLQYDGTQWQLLNSQKYMIGLSGNGGGLAVGRTVGVQLDYPNPVTQFVAGKQVILH